MQVLVDTCADGNEPAERKERNPQWGEEMVKGAK